ncbi:MAG: hypothetical protein K1X92_12695 [Bacteroidia bacterium]|nr:hypothetical protein [Bacteroidia bacterium]
MKSFFSAILLLFSVNLFYAQDLTEGAINELMKQGGYAPKTMQYGKLKEAEAMFRDFMFEKGKSYFVVAYGEEGVLDVDVEMLNNLNQVLAKDKDSEPLALIKYEPAENQYLKIIVKNFNSQSRNHPYVIKYLIYHKSLEDTENEKEAVNSNR